MNTSFHFSVDSMKPIPKSVIEGLPARHFQNPSGRCNIDIYDLLSDAPHRFIDALEKARASIRFFSFGMKRASNDEFTTPESLTVGAMLLSDGYCHPDPRNVFDPKFTPPHFGKVPEDQPLLVDRKPDCPICDVLDEVVFSERLCRFFQRHVDCKLGDVVQGGQVLPDWHRVFPARTEGVIVQEGLYETPCLCGTLLCCHPGVVLGRRVPEWSVCRNAIGMDHLGLFPPIIVSVPVAKEMIAMRLRGFGIEPIIDVDSDIGQRILELMHRAQAMIQPIN